MMNLTILQQNMASQLPDVELRMEEPLEKHTSFRIGGPAEIMAFPKNRRELQKLYQVCASLACKPRLLGAGTNVLAPDAGVRGVVVCLKDCLDGVELLDETHIRCMAGVTMARAAVFAAGQGLSGMEFAHGIPGTVGGGVYMNAGAYGGEICDICTEVEAMEPDGTCFTLDRTKAGFSYRHSVFQQRDWVILSAVFALEPRSELEIRARMQELLRRRKSSQPLDLPSAGSAFKRPVEGYAAALIDQAGLRGFTVGGAGVSQKHTGFVVNLGDATAADVRQVLRQVSDRVYTSSGIRLEPEVRIWSEEGAL